MNNGRVPRVSSRFAQRLLFAFSPVRPGFAGAFDHISGDMPGYWGNQYDSGPGDFQSGPFGPYALLDHNPVCEGFKYTGAAGRRWLAHASKTNNEWTIEALFFATALNEDAIVSAAPGGLYARATDVLQFTIWTTQSYFQSYGNAALPLNTWVLAHAVYSEKKFLTNNTRTKLFIDGTRSGTTDVDGGGTPGTPTAQILVGVSGWNSGWCGGIAWVGLYDYAFGPADVRQRMTELRYPFIGDRHATVQRIKAVRTHGGWRP